MRVTYHSSLGKFCAPDSAKLVVKGGQKFKVVRQHRRIGERDERTRRRAALLASMPKRKWVSISEVVGKTGG